MQTLNKNIVAANANIKSHFADINTDIEVSKSAKTAKIVKAGRPSKWNNRKTKMIRVPVEFAEELLKYAHYLDEGC